MLDAMLRSEEFREFAFPAQIAPPLLTRYKPGMHYGAHADAAYLKLPHGTVRSDLSCTIFLNEPEDYEGGALHIRLADASMRFKLKPGQAIVYPSDTLHEVEPVTKGERLVAITFIQSRVKDPFQRHMLFELNEVAALEGLKMDHAEFQPAAARPGEPAALLGRPALGYAAVCEVGGIETCSWTIFQLPSRLALEYIREPGAERRPRSSRTRL